MTFMTSPEATRLIRHGHSCLGVAGPAGLTPDRRWSQRQPALVT